MINIIFLIIIKTSNIIILLRNRMINSIMMVQFIIIKKHLNKSFKSKINKVKLKVLKNLQGLPSIIFQYPINIT